MAQAQHSQPSQWNAATPLRLRENGYVESFNGKLRDELLNAELFNTLLEARVLIEQWRVHYNRLRPHSSLGYRPPAPEAIVSGVPMLPPGQPGLTGSHQPSLTQLHQHFARTTQWGLVRPAEAVMA